MQTLAWGDRGQASRVHQAESWFRRGAAGIMKGP